MSAHRLRRIAGATVLLFLAPLAVVALPAPANAVHVPATLQLDGTTTQLGRMSRNGVVSACGTPKVYPGALNAATTYNVATTTFVAPVSGCLTITEVGSTCTSTNDFLSVYLGAYHPTIQDAHYLGDAGVSIGTGTTGSFSVDVEKGMTYVVVANNATTQQVCDVNVTLDMADDTTPPDTVFSPAPPTKVRESSVVLGFSGQPTDDTAGFQCQVDGGAFAACTNPLELDHLSVGSHTVAVRAVDAVGNLDPTPATATFLSCDLAKGERDHEAAQAALAKAERAVAKAKHALAKAKTPHAKAKAKQALRTATKRAKHAARQEAALQRGIHACAQ